MNQPFKSTSAQILEFALDHDFNEEEMKVVQQCINDVDVMQTFLDHRQDEQFLIDLLKQKPKNESDGEEYKTKSDFKQLIEVYKDQLSDAMKFVFLFSSSQVVDGALIIESIKLAEKMFSLGELTLYKAGLVGKCVTQLDDQTTSIDFHAFVSELQQRKPNVIDGRREFYLRFPNILIAIKFTQDPDDEEFLVTFMRELCDIISKQRKLNADHKLAILETAILYLHYVVQKLEKSYSEARVKIHNPNMKYKIKSSYKKIKNKIQLASERLHFFKQKLNVPFYDFDSHGKLRFASQVEPIEYQHSQIIREHIFSKLAYKEHYSKIFLDDRIYINVALNQYTVNFSGAVIHLRNFGNKFKGFSLSIVNQKQSPTDSKANPLNIMLRFKQAVSKVKFFNSSSRAFVSKQLLQTNPQYRRTFMVEYLSDKEQFEGGPAKMSSSNIKPLQPVTEKSSKDKMNKYPINFSQLAEFNKLQYSQGSLNLDDPDWDVLQCDENTKLQAIVQMISYNGIPQKYNLDISELRTFLFLLRHHYNKRKNPFHNFDHALTVMHGCFYLGKLQPVSQIFDDFYFYGFILSGLCHDVDHRATTNLFLINSGDKLANRYLDKSVLENHHAATTFKLLSNANADIMRNLDQNQKVLLKKMIVNNILATDVREHFSQLSAFETKLNQLNDGYDSFKTEDQILHLQGLLTHASDFFGSTKPYLISKVWSTKINAEFSKQYETEQKLELPLTPYFKDVDQIQNQAKGELGFIRVIVKPLWELLNRFYEGKVQALLENMDQAMEQWEIIFQQHSQQQ